MRKAFFIATHLLASLAATQALSAHDVTREYSVQVDAAVQSVPPQITLHWQQDECTLPKSYTVYRKAPGETSWGNPSTVPGTATQFVDRHVTTGKAYEYQIIKHTDGYSGYGYIEAGISVPMLDNRGKLLLVLDNTYVSELSPDLATLQQDLVGDGWNVVRLEVGRHDSVTSVKQLIRAQYNEDPANVKAVFLFGHVPVPYSGDVVPDGHMPSHRGAWPCDGFYGDMDGVWTDKLVDNTSAEDPRNRNVPGDGKFDQSTFPAPIKLMVGRVDMAKLPGAPWLGGPASFPSELELLKNYLHKDHAYRTKAFDMPRRAVIGDFFGKRDGEAFAASAWRNFAPLLGPENVSSVSEGAWASNLGSQSCLFAYGCGPGSYVTIGGLGQSDSYHDVSTRELYTNDLKSVFTLVFGSWLGDWDSEDNIMRTILASKDYGLASAWSGRPHWFIHPMALGEPIGYTARLTQNNGVNGLYQNELNSCAGQIHIALMGDPTLRMHTVKPPSDLVASTQDGKLTLNWKPSDDCSIVGYHVYRSTSGGSFERLTRQPISGSSYADNDSVNGGANYMVRAVKLENTPSGTYYNPSQGAFLAPLGESIAYPVATKTVPAANAIRPPTATGRNDSTNNIHAPLTPTGTSNVVNSWVDDSVPAGAQAGTDGGDVWNWVSSNPAPYSGSVAHQSTLSAGLHQHFFYSATQTLNVNSGDVMIAWVFLDPANPPSELMLQWNNGSWEHRAYWGANDITYGANGTASSFYAGPLPSAGQWAMLQIPASQVGLEGSTLNGMAFSLYDGRATWDLAGTMSVVVTSGSGTNSTSGSGTNSTSSGSGTNVVSSGGSTNTGTSGSGTNSSGVAMANSNNAVSLIDYTTLELPNVGDNTLHVLTPTLLELKLINSKTLDPAQVANWNFVNNFVGSLPAATEFTVQVNGQPVTVTRVGFKRRPLYAPLETYDLRIENSMYLQLTTPVSAGQTVQVSNPDTTLWPGSMQFVANADPLRYSPAIHVNQEGYMPGNSKKAMVGYYAGSLGEVAIPTSSGFQLVDANTGAQVYSGTLVSRPDSGWTYTPAPYQQVYEADFSSFTTPGEYRLVVPGMGASLPFLIDNGIAMSFARAYALGLYHQRCGTATAMPYTRFTHDPCHTAPAAVPTTIGAWQFTWTTISNYAVMSNPDNPVQTAPRLTSPSAALFPYVNQGPVDVSGGHHDAGDYSKYLANSANLVHDLMFAVDSLPGVAALDNLGIPESGDGIPDLLQEAKWEADFIAKMQDTDGGFYFLVYPQNREYEGGVTPDHGDAQVVWPKTTSVTAGAVAALAQCATSPAFKKTYPAVANTYMQKAMLGWQFLTNAINKYGKNGAYQKITHYGDDFADQDELAWAACQMYLATGDSNIHQLLLSWFDPSNPATWRWGWWHMSECYGHCIRSYAFAVQSGRVSAGQLDPTFLSKCQAEIAAAGDAALSWSQQSAYGTSFPSPTKAVQAAGWYFSASQAFDIAVAYQLNPKPDYMTAMLGNMNYEGGANPLNVCYITGLGWKRQRDIVSQWHSADYHVLPPSGIPVGNVDAGFPYNYMYITELQGLTFPSDTASTAPYPFYDRWGDSWNVTSEFTVQDAARGIGTLAFLAAQTSLKSQAWQAPAGAQISVPSGTAAVGSPITVSLSAPGIDLSGARITWEARDQQPTFGQTYTFSPKNGGSQWVEAEAQLGDGRRIFAKASFNANSPNLIWVDDSVPAGATAGADGGDSWNWVSSSPTPNTGTVASQSNIGAGEHQHFFQTAGTTLAVGTGDVLYAYVYVDPANPPSELMLQWNDGSSWEHRAYWGSDIIAWGIPGTVSQHYMGPVPTAGQWVQLSVPASAVGLEGATLNGMGFTLFGGRATWDTAGRLSTNVTTPSATVSVSATSNGSLAGLQPGVFTVSRNGDTSKDLPVVFSLSGTATNGVDYQSNSAPTTVTIPAGSTSASVSITPLATTNVAMPKTVTMTLASNTIYAVGTPAKATLTLGGNTVPVGSMQVNASGARLSWTGASNAVYQVLYKNHLTDSNWLSLGGPITGSVGSASSWVDTSATNVPSRFYIITRIQ